MPQTSYKPDPLSKQIRRIWRENGGNWLLAVAVLVSMLAWLVGYFDLIPVIETVDQPNFASPLLGGATLMVDISGCASDEGKVVAMLYDGRGFNDSSVPLRMEALPIAEGRAHWDVHNLSYGSYAIYAFQDLDGNEIVDPKKERQGISLMQPTPPDSTGFNYSAAAFDFMPQQRIVQVELQ